MSPSLESGWNLVTASMTRTQQKGYHMTSEARFENSVSFSWDTGNFQLLPEKSSYPEATT